MDALSRHPLYSTWTGIKHRCLNRGSKAWPHYGGRGIRIHYEWISDFELFVRDVGERPGDGFSLDRVDNDGHYEPGNVRWATASQQAINKRTTVETFVKLRASHPLPVDAATPISFPMEDVTLFLAQIRIARGLTQQQLAERLGLKKQQIQAYESGAYARASLERILAVLQALGATPRPMVFDLPEWPDLEALTASPGANKRKRAESAAGR